MASVEVEQFTDPFSPWCWAAQPTLRRLRYEFEDVAWTPRMTLLVPDPATRAGRAERDAADGEEPDDDAMRRTRWAATAAAGGLPVADGLWADSLPSSRLACAAVAFVRESAPDRALPVLRRLRVAAIAEGRPLDETDGVAAVVGEVDGVEAAAVRRGLDDGRAADALVEDLERAVEVAEGLDAVEVRGDVRLLDAAERLRSLQPDESGAETPPNGGETSGAAADDGRDGETRGAEEGNEAAEPTLLGPPALRVERESVVVVDPRLPFSRLASALGRAVPQTGIEIDDVYATSRMARHVPRDVAESLSSQDFGATVRPYLARFGEAYLPEVVAGTGVSRDTCRGALDSLVERGQAERVGPEAWRIVEGGRGPGPET